MRLGALLVLGGGAVLAAAAAASPDSTTSPATPPPATAPRRVLLVGDSYAVGFGPELGRLAEASGRLEEWSARAIVGSNVSQWKKWILADLPSFRPSHVLLSQGGNDFGRPDRDVVKRDTAALLGAVMDAHAQPIWIAPPATPFEDKLGVRAIWRELLGAAPWFDSEPIEIPRAPSDPLGHPTPAGYVQWARAIWAWLEGGVL